MLQFIVTLFTSGHVYELRGGSKPVKSILKSPSITVEDTKCVGFYYWIGGTEDASLTGRLLEKKLILETVKSEK